MLLLTIWSAAAQPVAQRGCRRSLKPAQLLSRRSQSLPQPGGDFYVGHRHQLTVLVSFADKQFQESNPLEFWNRVFNEPGFHESPFCGSVYDYFLEQSRGQLSLTFDLYHIALPEASTKYRSTATEDENSKYLVSDLIDVLQGMDIDWSQYDWNGDGFVNQLLIIYAGKGQNDGGGSNTIWPHQMWLSQHIDCQPRQVSCGDRQYLVDSYCCVNEITRSSTYGTFGTICHEYSHCFGFPDFYDASGSTKYAGEWDLMSNGNYNNGGFCPPNYSAHERWLMGWQTPVELTAAESVSDMTSDDAYLIRNDGYDQEYYIIENRQQRGWDQSLPGSGILVFHVDYDPAVWLSMEVSANTANLQHYSIFRAGGSSSQSSWPYPYQANDSLTNTSVPAAVLNHLNIDGTRLMSKPLTHMFVSDSGLASFHFMGGSSTAVVLPEASAAGDTLYEFGPIAIVRKPNGSIVKVIKARRP